MTILATPLSLLLAAAQPGGPMIVSPAPVAPKTFVKGELTNAGSIRLGPRDPFIGARIGALVQDTTFYLSVAPKADLRFLDESLKIGIEVPLNIEIYGAKEAVSAGNADGGFSQAGRLRPGDWDEARDFAKLVRYITYGKKEDKFYLSVGQLHAATLGHGQQMRRYAANVDVNQTRVGLAFDAYYEYGGFEFALADVTQGTLFGALGFIKPLALVSEHPILRSVSIGASVVTDQDAPWQVRRAVPIGNSPIGVVLVRDTLIPEVQARSATIMALDAEVKYFKDENYDLKAYIDYSALADAGSGITIGTLGRMNFHTDDLSHLIRARFEVRNYEANFAPSYFDSLYEFQKYQFVPDAKNPQADFSTKLSHITRRRGDRRTGVYAEVSYAIPTWVTVAAAFETETEGEDQHLMLHAEVPMKYLKLFATYHQRNLQDLFSFSQNDLLFAGARLQVLPVLFLNGRVQKSFEWDSTAFNSLGAFGESLNYEFDVEFGFRL